MRDLAEIDAEIARAEAVLRALRTLRQQKRDELHATIYRQFDRGASVGDLASRYGTTYSAMRGLLHRSGRTDGGRAAIRLHAVAERHTSSVTA